MSWWLWLLLGVVLSALELAAFGGFYLIFFGVGAFFVGLFTALDLTGPPAAQWSIFALASIVLLLVFRRQILRIMQPAQVDVDTLVGEIAVPMDNIKPGEVGRAEVRGTAWSAKNSHTEELPSGARCRVNRVDGLTLFLVPDRSPAP